MPVRSQHKRAQTRRCFTVAGLTWGSRARSQARHAAPLPSSTHPTSQQKVLVWLISTNPKQLSAPRALPHLLGHDQLPHLLGPALQSTQERSQQPEEETRLLLLVSPVPGQSPSTQHQRCCHLPWAAPALTVAGPQVTAWVGLPGTQGLQGASAQSPPAHKHPKAVQPFAQSPSPSCPLTQTSHIHSGEA